ncbi:MAG: hypothetical protein FJZ63_01005 [Chlamydiae bacterium]|nr:hypothetical protein [Chlamydiota bacterium]
MATVQEPTTESKEKTEEINISVGDIVPDISFEKRMKTGKPVYQCLGPDGRGIKLSENSLVPEPGKLYRIKIVGEGKRGDLKADKHKGFWIGEIYFESTEDRALDMVKDIEEKQSKAHDAKDWEEINRLMREVMELYASKEEQSQWRVGQKINVKKDRAAPETAATNFSIKEITPDHFIVTVARHNFMPYDSTYKKEDFEKTFEPTEP